HHAHAAAAELFEQAESCVAREHPLAARGSTGESRGSLGRLSRLAQEVEVETPPRDATAGERGDRIGVVEDQLANLECTLVAVRRVTPDQGDRTGHMSSGERGAEVRRVHVAEGRALDVI